MTSFLGVPIISKGLHLGSLYLSDRIDGRPFSTDDERLINLLAGHAAIAIENARLYEQLRRLAIVEERDRIAMELHDGIIQSIYAIGIRLELARTTQKLDAELNAQLNGAAQDLNRVIEDLRRYIQDLKRGVDYSLSLHEQLNEIAEGLRNVSSARLVLDVATGFTHLNEDRLHTIVQVIREALSNIVRHSGATEIYLDLHETLQQIVLTIADDGQGFDPTNVTEGNGLRNMRHRAERVGGKIDIVSVRKHGTTLTLIVPT
jgi:signal transduction histidine kinase